MLPTGSSASCNTFTYSAQSCVQGTVRCLGSPQHLKTKYGGGYVLEARLPVEHHSALLERAQAAFPAAACVSHSEDGSDVLQITLQQQGLDVPALFEFVEAQHAGLGIMTYAVSQSTLEHVFVRIANGGDLHIGSST